MWRPTIIRLGQLALAIVILTALACREPVRVVIGQAANCGQVTDVTIKLLDNCTGRAIEKPADVTVLDTSQNPNTVVDVVRSPERGTYTVRQVTMCDITYLGDITAQDYAAMTNASFQFYAVYAELYLTPLDNPHTPFDEAACQTAAEDPPVDPALAFRSGYCSCLAQANALPTPPSSLAEACCNNAFLAGMAGYGETCGTSPPRVDPLLCEGLQL